jgi:hypothetical protein
MAEYEGEPQDPYRPQYPAEVRVEPQSLADFAHKVTGDLGALQDAWNNAKADMENQPSPNFPGEYAQTFHYASGYPELAYNGDAGIREGRAFYQAYFRTVGAELALMRDMMLGLETLRRAAEMIHTGYFASDAANAGSVEETFAAYERSSVLYALGEATDPTEGGTGDEQR